MSFAEYQVWLTPAALTLLLSLQLGSSNCLASNIPLTVRSFIGEIYHALLLFPDSERTLTVHRLFSPTVILVVNSSFCSPSV